jgi:hypothetical protein
MSSTATALRLGNFAVGAIGLYYVALGLNLQRLTVNSIPLIINGILSFLLILSDFKEVPFVKNYMPFLFQKYGRAITFVVVGVFCMNPTGMSIIFIIAAVTAYLAYTGTEYPKPSGSWFGK